MDSAINRLAQVLGKTSLNTGKRINYHDLSSSSAAELSNSIEYLCPSLLRPVGKKYDTNDFNLQPPYHTDTRRAKASLP